MGPKRLVPAALDIEHPNLPAIDFVVISHNHYDHLDYNTVKRLNKRFGKDLTWYGVPFDTLASHDTVCSNS